MGQQQQHQRAEPLPPSLPPAAVCLYLCAFGIFPSGRRRAAVLIMGDVQSTQRGSRQDAAAEEESREVDNPQTEQNTKPEVSPRTRTVLFSRVMLSCVTEVLRLLVLRANSSINIKMKQRI